MPPGGTTGMKMRTVDSTGPRTRTTSRRRSRSASTAATVAAVALLAAGCGDDGDSTTAGPAAEDDGSAEGGAEGLEVDITAPDDQADVGDPFDVELATSVELGDPDSSPYHVHLYYDGATGDGEFDMVFAPTFTVDRDLGPGEHTVEAVVVNADHSPTDAKDEITVTVGDAGSSGGEDGPTTTDAPADEDDGGGYGYGY